MPDDDRNGFEDEHTRRTPLAEALAEELSSVRASLEALPDSPRSRELRVRVAKYEHALSSCRGTKADGAQQRALCELVCKLRTDTEALCDATPTGRLGPPARRDSPPGSRSP
jgi:hypothetical protein